MKLDTTKIAPYFIRYTDLVLEDDINTALEKQYQEFSKFLETIPSSKQEYAYAEGKWTIKDVVQHIIDAERVFAYRALCFARKDKTSLPGFDENLYADTANGNLRSWDDLVAEFKVVRQSTIYLFQSFNEEQLNAAGIANGNPNYVLGLGYITVGHCTHHVNILQERYL